MLIALLKRFRFAPFHILLWFLVWLFYIYFFSYNSNNQSFVLWFSFSLLPLTISATYIFSDKIIPDYLLKQKYVQFVIYSSYTIISSLFFILLIVFFGFMLKAYFNLEAMPLLTRNFVFVFILVYLVVGIVSFINLLRHHYRASNQNKVLKNKLLEGKLLLKQKELDFLKQQIHPHFLFNTLNTIYASALKESKETPELVLQLSNLLDYVLHQLEKPFVDIEDEIQYLNSYIGLERTRFKESLQISFVKTIQDTIQIPPMLLMAFVENAFKHGGRVDGVLKIATQLHVTKEMLHFKIENSLGHLGPTKEGHGLGLQNTINRLNSLYPEKYHLDIVENENTYLVELKIDVSNEKNYVQRPDY